MRIVFMLALLVVCPFSMAAENALPTQDATDAAQQDASDSTQNGADDGSDLIAAELEGTNDDEEDASARFIPTEQISQDLGVSFPVDI